MPFLAEQTFPIPTQDILSWYFDNPSYDLDKPVYIDALDETLYWTGAQAKQAIKQLAAGFLSRGLVKGDCVCLHSFNSINYPILVNGIVGFGGVFAGTNPAYLPAELVHHLKTSKAKIVIVEPELVKHVLQAAKEIGIAPENILSFNRRNERDSTGLQSWWTLFEHGEVDWPRFNSHEIASNTTAARLFSSGTTGLPKAGELSHHNLITEDTLVNSFRPLPWKKRKLVALPMFHAATVPGCHFSPLRSGDSVWVLKRFEIEQYLRCMEKYQITDGAMVPPVVVAIITSPLSQKYSLKSLKVTHIGAAPLGKATQARYRALTHQDSTVTQVWGMTETSCVCSMSHWEDGDEATGSVGQMLPNMDAKLVDDNGNDITDFDVQGELCVRGPLVIKGYFENPEANARDWDKDGYFHTGDIAYRGSQNRLWYIVDRKKELIKVRGFQVAPPELETVLLSHPNIVDAAVIGVKDKDNYDSELPRGYIVRRPGSGDNLSADEVHSFMAERLASFKKLQGGVQFVDSIPKNASGKILKRILRDELAKESQRTMKSKL